MAQLPQVLLKKLLTIRYFGAHDRDEPEYLNIRIFKYFGARMNIRIRFQDKVHIQIYSNIRSVL